MEEGGKITPLRGHTYLNAMTDTAKLRVVILLFNNAPAAVGISGKSARIPSENIWKVIKSFCRNIKKVSHIHCIRAVVPNLGAFNQRDCPFFFISSGL